MSVDPGQFNRGHGATIKTFSDDSQMQTRKVAVQTITEDTVLTTPDMYVRCDCSDGAIKVTFPDVSVADGQRYFIKKIDSSINKVTIVGTGDDTIEEADSLEMTEENEALPFIGVASASNWDIAH